MRLPAGSLDIKQPGIEFLVYGSRQSPPSAARRLETNHIFESGTTR
jgi:hypothetical protein